MMTDPDLGHIPPRPTLHMIANGHKQPRAKAIPDRHKAQVLASLTHNLQQVLTRMGYTVSVDTRPTGITLTADIKTEVVELDDDITDGP